MILCALAALTAPDYDAAGKRWWRHVEYLASDALEGRDVGSAGYDKAADYVADQFKKAGLSPGANGTYFQKVDFTSTAMQAGRSDLALERDGKTTSVAVPEEALLGYNANSSSVLNAPLVFAGYGLKIPDAHHDDLEGLSLQGAVVVFLTGGPDKIDGNLRSHYSSTEERWKAFHAAGAVGMISIPNPKTMEVPWTRTAANWGKPHMAFADPTMDSVPGLLFSATWNPDHTDDLFTKSGHTFSEVLKAAEAQQPLPRFDLPSKVRAHVAYMNSPVASKNVVGIRPGDDPKLKNEYLIISAHLDHLGIGKPVNGDAIFNGAMDDASGDASLIEIARAIQESKIPIARSIVFLAVTGEEKGELGSQFFARQPTVQGKIIADLNMDMFLPLFPLEWLEVQGLNESSLGGDLRAVAESAGVKVQADKEPNRNRFIRSDQYSFVKTGVPALAFKFGYIPGGPEEKVFKAWYTDRYHGVSDDSKQPVDLAAAAKFNEILKNLAVRVANAEKPPAWSGGSFFRRFAPGS